MNTPEAGSEDEMPKWIGERDLRFAGPDIVGAETRYYKQISAFTVRVNTLRRCIRERDKRINELEDLLKSSNERADELECTIADMQRSVLWQLLRKYQFGFVERVLPRSTGRREKYDFALKSGKVLFNKGWSSFYKSFINPRSMQSRFDSEHSRKEASSLKERNEPSRCNFKNYGGKKFILLKNAEIRADKNAVKTELEDILKRLNGEI